MKPLMDGLLKDTEKRLRAALHKLDDRLTDIEIAERALWLRHHPDDPPGTERNELSAQASEVHLHVYRLRGAIATLVVCGRLNVDTRVEEALRVSAEPRRSCRGQAPKPPKPAGRAPALDAAPTNGKALAPGRRAQTLEAPVQTLLLPEHVPGDEP